MKANLFGEIALTIFIRLIFEYRCANNLQGAILMREAKFLRRFRIQDGGHAGLARHLGEGCGVHIFHLLFNLDVLQVYVKLIKRLILFRRFNNGKFKRFLWPLLFSLGGIPVGPLYCSRGKEIPKHSSFLEYILFTLILKCEILRRIPQFCGFLIR